VFTVVPCSCSLHLFCFFVSLQFCELRFLLCFLILAYRFNKVHYRLSWLGQLSNARKIFTYLIYAIYWRGCLTCLYALLVWNTNSISDVLQLCILCQSVHEISLYTTPDPFVFATKLNTVRQILRLRLVISVQATVGNRCKNVLIVVIFKKNVLTFF